MDRKVFTDNIETERLILKNIDMEDREFIFSQFSDDHVNRYLFDAEPLTDLDGADEIIGFYLQPEPRSMHRWILVRKSDGVKMGTCGFHCWNIKDAKVEIGYDLKKEFWGNGYMYEALSEIIRFAKSNMGIRQIDGIIYVENCASIQLAKKLGFVLSGSKDEVFRGEQYLHNIYTLNLEYNCQPLNGVKIPKDIGGQ